MRFREHHCGGKALSKTYTGKSHQGKKTFGGTAVPSLPRLIARFGAGMFSMLPMQYVTTEHPLCLEGEWNTLCAPTVNARDPAHVPLREEWSTLLNAIACPSECKQYAKLVNTVISNHAQVGHINDLLLFMADVNTYVKGPEFDKLFSVIAKRVNRELWVSLPRRITLHLPSYSSTLSSWLQDLLKRACMKHSAPSGIKHWLMRAVTIVPVKAAKVVDAVRKHQAPVVAEHTIAWLTRNIPLMPENPYPNKIPPYQNLQSPLSTEQLQALRATLRAKLQKYHCACSAWQETHPCLANPTGHVILRTTQQPTALLLPNEAKLLVENARVPLLPNPTHLTDSLARFRLDLVKAVIPVAIPHCDRSLPAPLLPLDQVDAICHSVRERCLTEIQACHSRAPWLSEATRSSVQSTMRHMQLVGHFWDKQPTKVSAQFFKLNEFRCLDNILTGKKFPILGFAPCPTWPRPMAYISLSPLRSKQGSQKMRSTTTSYLRPMPPPPPSRKC